MNSITIYLEHIDAEVYSESSQIFKIERVGKFR